MSGKVKNNLTRKA